MKQISSSDNAFYKALQKLVKQPRQRRNTGQTLLDGTHLLDAAMSNGIQPVHILVESGFEKKPEISGLLQRAAEVPVTALGHALFSALTELKTSSGILALINIPVVTRAVEQSTFCLLLEDIQDPGNLGSILRSAAAAGCDTVYLSAGCADAWSPKVLRAAMGGHFVLGISENADLMQVAEKFRGKIYAASLAGRHSLYDCRLMGDVAFAIGNEGAGLSAELQAACEPFIIPMSGKIESLNAAAAAAVSLFEATRQRNLKH